MNSACCKIGLLTPRRIAVQSFLWSSAVVEIDRQPPSRHLGLDWLRVGAFGLLIFYHVGMFFVPWEWHVKTARPFDWVAMPMLATASWRLELLFVVSGFASVALLKKCASRSALLRERSARLLIPLLFGILVVLPPQPWVELVFQHGYRESLGWFWVYEYYRPQSINGVVVPTWNHLWFVAYLWTYTVLLLLLIALPDAAKRWAERAFATAFAGWGILVLPIMWKLFVALGPGRGVEITHGLVDDLSGHLYYVPAYLLGVGFARVPQVLDAAAERWKVSALVAVTAYLVVLWVEWHWPGNQVAPLPYDDIMRGARAIQGGAAITAALGIAHRFLQRDHPWRATLTEAVFPFYIIHQTIIVWIGWWLLRFELAPIVEFAILLTATVAGCMTFYLLGRRIKWARPLIGLKKLDARKLDQCRKR